MSEEQNFNAMQPVVIIGFLALAVFGVWFMVTDKWRVNVSEEKVVNDFLSQDNLRKSDDGLTELIISNSEKIKSGDIGNANKVNNEAGSAQKNDGSQVGLAQNPQMSQNSDSSNLKLGANSKADKLEKVGNSENYKQDNSKNMTESNVVTTESGLQYEVLVMGDGPKPTLTDEVEVHYHGTLLDGTVFDSSVDRGEKISFPLNGVITGWQEGLQLMPVGSKFKFTIPANLAYGDRAMGQIPAGSTLIFEVELFEIK